MSFATEKLEAAAAPATGKIREHPMAVLVMLIVLLILVFWLVHKVRSPSQGYSGSMGPTVTNYNQSSDQTAVGDTAGTLNVNLTGADILASSDFGCATRQPFSDDDAWGWMAAQAAAPGTEGLFGRKPVQGAKALVHQGLGQTVHHLGQTVHHLQRGITGRSEGVKRRQGASAGVLDSQLTAVMNGH
jgi:hypothetical protein